MEEHSPHHPKVEGLSPAPTNKVAMKYLRCLANFASSDSTVVEHSHHHPKVEGLSPAPGDKVAVKDLSCLAICACGKLYRVQGSSPTTADKHSS